MSFADQLVATGGIARSWTSLRFTLISGPEAGSSPNANLDMIGCRNLAGTGYTREGVTVVYGSGGTGQGLRITPGRLKVNEATLGMDPGTWRQVWSPNTRRIIGGKWTHQPALFSVQMQCVDAAGNPEWSWIWTDCVDTGLDVDTPEGGEAVEQKVKFQATRLKIIAPF